MYTESTYRRLDEIISPKKTIDEMIPPFVYEKPTFQRQHIPHKTKTEIVEMLDDEDFDDTIDVVPQQKYKTFEYKFKHKGAIDLVAELRRIAACISA